MQKAARKPIEPVRKPTLIGKWNGRSALKMARGRALSFLIIAFVYLLCGLILNFDALWMKILSCVIIVGASGYAMYARGADKGTDDAAFGEIMYERKQTGKTVSEIDEDRCFHPAKGFFAVLIGSIPFLIFTIVFACLTKKDYYTLGLLPSWTEGIMRDTEFGSGLAYYAETSGLQTMDILRVIDRAMIMPFATVASSLGDDAALLAERLSPLLILIAPICYGVGYTRGIEERVKINTGILLGVEKKRKKERKERKKRQAASKTKQPEQLI